MIDWTLAARLAALVAGKPEGPPLRPDLGPLAVESERLVVAYTGLEPRAPLPRPERVGRAEWAQANVASMRRLLDPVLAKAGGKGPLGPAARLVVAAVATAEVGVILGFLAQRVLGQYELVLLEPTREEEERRPPRLLFVEPNLVAAVDSFGVDETEFVTWVTLHEVTHAVQFGGVPWLQGYLGGLIGELLAGMEVRLDASRVARVARLPDRNDLRRLVDAVREGDLLSLVARPEERALLDRVQAVMAVIEGHAEHVMDEVGAPLLPSIGELRAALDRRRRSASAPVRILTRLLGLELKLRQYTMGKRFCDAVVREGGPEALHRVWSGPEALPTLAELEDPSGWLERTRVLPAAG